MRSAALRLNAAAKRRFVVEVIPRHVLSRDAAAVISSRSATSFM
jgi:hypothetical protein